MVISQNISLDYTKVRLENGTLSHGGSQQWFPKDEGFRDKAIHTGGCGLIAIFDFMLWYETHAAGSRKGPFSGLAGKSLMSGPVPDREAYMDGIRRLYRRYPSIPKLGTSALLLPVCLNIYLRSRRAKMRVSFLFRNTAGKRMRILEGSLLDGFPVIMDIGAKVNPFSKQKGVTFYKEQNGELKPGIPNVHRHFVTVTGMRYPEDATEPVYLEISSWGRKYFVNYDELCSYMTKSSMPWLTGFFFVKTERGTKPFEE